MSDGPHRSLTMRQAWKRLAEHADNPAAGMEELIQLGGYALEDDLREEFPDRLLRQIQFQHIAELSERFEELPSLKNEVFFLSRFFDLDTAETRQRLLGRLRKHREEWNGFVESLGSVFFINQWAKGSR